MSEAIQALEPTRPRKTPRRLILGRAAVVLAIAAALTSFLIFAGFVPQIPPTDVVVLTLFVINLVCILVLIGFVMVEAWSIIAARRRQAAGARLHIRIVGLFTIIAIVPAILMAFVGSVTLDRSLNPVFLRDVRGFILRTGEAARFFQEGQCRVLLREAQLTASDLDRGESLYKADKSVFHEFFASRVEALGFGAAAMIHPDGRIDDKVVAAGKDAAPIVRPQPNDFSDAQRAEPLCMVLDEGRTFVALRKLDAFGDAYLYVARPVGPFSVEFAQQATKLITFYDMFDAYRHRIQIAFATMYVLIALVMLLAATWVGLSFANSLVAPIRRLITAADEVGSGNLDVHVAVNPSEGDLGHLGETFNKMTSEIRQQQNRLIAASALIDERRLFTEAVLSGVPVAVIGVGANGQITVVNPSAERLIPHDNGQSAVGQPIDHVLPEVTPVLDEARASNGRLSRGQISVHRGGRERTFNLLVTTEPGSRTDKNYVITLDDITDLVSAQRTAAWADVARRIAHEIKNPLTPIQLSAERLKRKYGRLVVSDRDVFDQCIDTIVRQVDDIKRMVDEFSAFARMPRARLVPDDVTECLRQVIFLMRVGHPNVEFVDQLPQTPVIANFDRRLLSQAVTNITKNATEGIAAVAETEPLKGKISLSLDVTPEGLVEILITDNGKGFPKENRHRLLEPYMTTRAEGTGLGLPIVAKILEDHGGGIELLDAPDGRGACVRLFFPQGDIAHRNNDISEEKRPAVVVESAK
jgi:two-component system, NtrC family, nitrogen regulation sensor histidine kinase NtrY